MALGEPDWWTEEMNKRRNTLSRDPLPTSDPRDLVKVKDLVWERIESEDGWYIYYTPSASYEVAPNRNGDWGAYYSSDILGTEYPSMEDAMAVCQLHHESMIYNFLESK